MTVKIVVKLMNLETATLLESSVLKMSKVV